MSKITRISIKTPPAAPNPAMRACLDSGTDSLISGRGRIVKSSENGSSASGFTASGISPSLPPPCCSSASSLGSGSWNHSSAQDEHRTRRPPGARASAESKNRDAQLGQVKIIGRKIFSSEAYSSIYRFYGEYEQTQGCSEDKPCQINTCCFCAYC